MNRSAPPARSHGHCGRRAWERFQRIFSAQPEQLEVWSLRVLDGKTLEDVLAVNETAAGYGNEGVE